MKLSVVAYYKFSELPPGLTFARHWNVSKIRDAFGARGGGGGSQLGRKSGTPPPTTWEGLKLQLPQYIRPPGLSSKGFLGAEHHGNCSPRLAQDGRGIESGSQCLESQTPTQPCARRWIRSEPSPFGSALRCSSHFLLRSAGLHLPSSYLSVLQTG